MEDTQSATGGSIASRAPKARIPLPPVLPAELSQWQRFIQTKRTINDQVEDAVRAILESDDRERYRRLMFAVHDSQTVEGSMACDNIEAARLIRDWAKEKDNSELSEEKLATIVKAHNVVLHRYHFTRKERRQMVDGEIVPNSDGTE